MEERDYLKEERQRLVGLVAALTLVFIIPFTLNNFLQGRLTVACFSLAIVVVLVSNVTAAFSKKPAAVDIHYLIPAVAGFLIICFYKQGLVGSFWCYPAIVCHHFMLPVKGARLATRTFLAVAIICGYFTLEPELFPRLLATLILTNLACHLFLRVISKQQGQLRTLSDSLQSKVVQLEETNEKLADSENSRREFIANLSHSLGTPLYSINLGLQTLESNRLEESERKELIRRLTRQLDWVNTASKRLMSLSRWETSTPEINLRPVLLSEPILDAVEALEEQLLEADIVLDMAGMRGIQVMADKEYLRDIVTALMENSVQHSGGRCSLCISVEPGERVALVEVRDTGQGMEASEVGQSLQRYYSRGGTGLGLPLAAHLVRAHGSELKIESDVGRGFKASFVLERLP